MAGKRRLTEDVKQKILEMYNDRSVVHTQREIADKFGVSQASVSKFIRKAALEQVVPSTSNISGVDGNFGRVERVIAAQRQQIQMLNMVVSSQGDTIAAQKELIERLKSTQQEVVLQGQDQVIQNLTQEADDLRKTIKQHEATIKAQELTIASLSATVATQEEMLTTLQKGKKSQK